MPNQSFTSKSGNGNRRRSREQKHQGQELSKIIDKLIYTLWSTISDVEAMHPANSRFYRVTIFGSARISSGDALYQDARKLACLLAGFGCDIVTGGGPGLMEAANEGSKECSSDGKTRSFGLTINLPFENTPNPYVDKVTAHRTFFSRLHHFVRMSNAYIVFPGGIGTALEAFMIWQLLQVKHIEERPLVFVGDMWEGLVAWMRSTMLKLKTVDSGDFNYACCVKTIEEAAEIIRKSKQNFDVALGRKTTPLPQTAFQRVARLKKG
ncbi:MAG TPA: LOG family protein [Acidobacteriota bacterium]|nr:LOG family protein [Acidobacteriota bacterium]